MLDLQPIKARLAAATPGPWDRDGEEEADDYGWSIYSNQNRPIASSDSYMDADLIGNAPADLAALMAEVERLRGAIKAHHQDKTAPGPTSVNSDDRKLWAVLP